MTSLARDAVANDALHQTAPMNKTRIDYLTCARFFAALLVLLHHASSLFPMAKSTELFLYNGYMGVTFFFVLSGFVIAASSFDEMQTPDFATVGRFYVRRVARIVPIWLFLSLPVLVSYLSQSPPTLTLWSYLTFTQAWSGDLRVTFSFLALSWTLSCEFFFYLIFPLFAWCVGRLIAKRPMTLFLLIALAVILPFVAAAWFEVDPARAALNAFDPASSHRWLYRFPPMRFCEFAFGVCLYLIWQRHAERWRVPSLRVIWLALAAAAIGAVLVLMALTSPGPFTWTAAYVVPFGMLVLSLAVLEPRHSVRNAGFVMLVLLGEASYSFYLVHQIFVLPNPYFSQRSWSSLAWTIVYCAAISVGLFTMIETPMRKFITGFFKERRPTEISPAIRDELSELGGA